MKKDEYINEILTMHRTLAERAHKPWNGLVALNLCFTLQKMELKVLRGLWGDMKRIEACSNGVRHTLGIDASCLTKVICD